MTKQNAPAACRFPYLGKRTESYLKRTRRNWTTGRRFHLSRPCDNTPETWPICRISGAFSVWPLTTDNAFLVNQPEFGRYLSVHEERIGTDNRPEITRKP